MKALTHPVSRTKAFWLATASAAFAATASASPAPVRPCAASSAPSGYPTFCGVPLTPTNVRSADAFRAAVLDVRLAGRQVARQSAPDTFSLPLGGAESFDAAARAAAAYPAPVAGPAGLQSDAFAAAARARATPPKSHRR
jgi:hypothetical protein